MTRFDFVWVYINIIIYHSSGTDNVIMVIDSIAIQFVLRCSLDA